MQPGGQGLGIPERTRLPCQRDKDGLKCVVGVRRRAKHATADAQHQRAELMDEGGECIGIVRGGEPGEQFRWRKVGKVFRKGTANNLGWRGGHGAPVTASLPDRCHAVAGMAQENQNSGGSLYWQLG